ncbi:hypothetical protein Pyn_05235 [Prunus yedoensis var. nudiflora]|uniref:Uncharacterized protein n=1 Tax=Prunus yedoensis var. nudiflora TaxID=2094558 RepID=A0A314UHG4_PRUYE|nr:hypothetical protein Pyn_05235 [Prunus yedoensis var. nudiflora]
MAVGNLYVMPSLCHRSRSVFSRRHEVPFLVLEEMILKTQKLVGLAGYRRMYRSIGLSSVMPEGPSLTGPAPTTTASQVLTSSTRSLTQH